MAYHYIDTPRTEAADLTAANISFSDVQGYPSPSKDARNNLIRQVRPRTAARSTRTPRAQSGITSLRPASKNEFTPLLKSAGANRFKNTSDRPHKTMRGKENRSEDLVNSMLAGRSNEAPQTPAYLRTGYRPSARTPGLPVDSSMIDASRSTIAGSRTPAVAPPISSSILSGTPIAAMPKRGEQGRTEQGNVLTLREQEAKLEKLDKENFNLKLKIHFLDEALKKSGTDYQQGMIKENTELKISSTTLQHDLKQQQKALARAEQELEEYRRQLKDFAEKVKRRHTDEIMKEEMERLRQQAEDNQRLVETRDEELETIRRRLEQAEQGTDDKAQDLRDDMADLEQELRAKDAELDVKDEEIEGLQEKVRSGSGTANEELQQDLEQLEAELEAKEAQLGDQEQEITDLKAQLQTTQDREKSTKKLRGDVGMMENQIRQKDETIDGQAEEIRSLQKRLSIMDAKTGTDLQDLSSELRDKDRLLEDKAGEIRALEERLRTARGSWDAEAQQSDARLQEKDISIQDRDAQLRDKARIIDEKDDQIADLRKRVESLESSYKDAAAQQDKQNAQKNIQVFELEQKLRAANSELDFHIDKKNVEVQKLQREIEALGTETRQLHERLDSRGSPTTKDAVIHEQAAKLRDLEAKLRLTVEEKDAEIEELEGQLGVAEDRLAAKQKPSDEKLAQDLETALQGKEALEDEVAVLETQLDDLQDGRKTLEQTIIDLRGELRQLKDKSHNSTPVRERNEMRLRIKLVEKQCEDYRAQVQTLEDELDKAWKNKTSAATPARQSNELRSKLADSEATIVQLRRQVRDLESDVQRVRDETISGEHRDLHNMLRDVQIENESLREKIGEQERRLAALLRKDGETRAQLQQAQSDRDDGVVDMAERDARIASLLNKEKDLRAQIQSYRQGNAHAEDLEQELHSKRDSSSGHARREAELRNELRTARANVEDLNREVQQRDVRLAAAKQKEQQLRERLHQARRDLDGTSFVGQNLDAQLSDAESEVQTLQAQLKDRERRLQTSLKREHDLRSRMKALRADPTSREAMQDDRRAKQQSAVESASKVHEKELRGLAKQIQYLSAKCSREESFRKDLAFVKRWFTLQVEMYGACNKADIALLREMGIAPTMEAREQKKRPSLKAAGHAVIAAMRMRKMQQAWAGKQKLHLSLMKKLETMRWQGLIAS